MPFIGNKPTSVPLTSSDITDGIITSAKIANGGVETVDIADANVTAAKLASGTVQNQSAFKNIIINGDMSIAQRATSTASVTTTGYYTCDRWNWITGYGTVTLSQDTDVPTGQGFATSFKADVTTAGTEASGEYVLVRQRIEGQNLQYLKKGTASAESLTASFWIKSTKTGTYIAELYDADNTRQISKSYTVDTTNTWEKKTITFAGDTSGAFGNDNGGSLFLNLYLSAGTDYTSGTLNTSWNSSTDANRVVGQVNAQDNTANNIYFTGVQLEAGTTASDFEFLPVDVNLGRCQRYYQKSYAYATAVGTNTTTGIRTTGGGAGSLTTGYIYGDIQLKGSMRTAPTITTYDKAGNSGVCARLNGGVARTDSQNLSASVPSEKSFTIESTGTANAGAIDVHYQAVSEL
jgi:hypothetical protein